MNNFKFGNSMGPSRMNLVSASPPPSKMSKTKIGLIVASLLVTLGALATVAFFVLAKGHTEVVTTDRPWENSTYPVETEKPFEWTTSVTVKPTEPEPEKDPAELSKLYEEMFMNMEEKVNPCDDFYEYACGFFNKAHPVPANRREVNYFSLEYEKIRKEIIEKLDGNSLKDKQSPLRYLKRVWDSCVNDKTETGSHLFSLMEYFKLLDGVDTWQEKFARATRSGFNVFFTVKAEYFHDRLDQAYFFSIDRPEIEYNNEHYYPLLEYYAEMIRLSKNSTASLSEYLELATEIIEFENWMSTNATSSLERIQSPWDFNSPWYQRQVNAVSRFDWSKIVQIVADTTLDGANFLVHDSGYLNKFKSIVDSKDESFLSEYIKMSIVRQSCFMMGRECREIHRTFLEQIDPSKVVGYEKQTCFDELSDKMEDLIYYAYISDGPRFNESALGEMVSKLIKELDHEVSQFRWMDQSTRDKAMEKVYSIRQRMRMRMLSMDANHESILESKYSPLIQDHGTNFDNFKNLMQHATERSMESLSSSETRDLNPWPVSLFSRFPKLVPLSNSLLVPALVLQGHFFHEKFPTEIKYGLLGSVLGHAMVHTVDGLAHKYHKSASKAFWSDDTKNNFDKQMQCLVDAYEKEEMVINGKAYDMKINGNTTLDENLADWMGVAMAYEAYRNISYSVWPTPPKADYNYAALNKLSKDQMFFLSYANVHCSSDSQQALMDVFLGTHSPRKFRVNGPLRQMRDFADAFKCNWDSKMSAWPSCSYH